MNTCLGSPVLFPLLLLLLFLAGFWVLVVFARLEIVRDGIVREFGRFEYDFGVVVSGVLLPLYVVLAEVVEELLLLELVEL